MLILWILVGYRWCVFGCCDKLVVINKFFGCVLLLFIRYVGCVVVCALVLICSGT